MDKLIECIDALKSPIVVGLDPTLEMIPESLQEEMFEKFGKTPAAVAEMFLAFNREIIDSVSDIVPAVKPQIAMYEKYGLDGVAAYIKTAEYASSKGLFVIGDIKRGDISSTAEAYAAHLSGTTIGGEYFDLWHEDAITVNPYLGSDGIAPFVTAATEADKSIFVLVKTSNPSSSELQDLTVNQDENGNYADSKTEPSPCIHHGATLYRAVATLVDKWGADQIGRYGYSRVGAVVGATHRDVGAELRKALPHTFFLVPGYGAQGATAEDLLGFFDKDGRGCIVNSSRGIIAAWRKKDGLSVGEAARAAAIMMRDELAHVIGRT
ncbi:MAG: orotidine-5'-phosphate decarboxylase [Clostridiales Family XIII bacterium]|jgi:orotidine-5'-phosphate decarboxylase|nr:orotidine-5'-phosphate decarboxylase [Clostridiales Family XIII bacterium]